MQGDLNRFSLTIIYLQHSAECKIKRSETSLMAEYGSPKFDWFKVVKDQALLHIFV